MTEAKPIKAKDREDRRVEDRILDTLTLDSPHTFTCQRGVVFQLQKVPKYLALEMGRKFKNLRPPLVDVGGGAMEPNPLDPDYLDAVTEQNADKGILTMKLFLSLGVTIKDRPADVEPPESTEWSDTLEELGFDTIPAGGRSRFHAWLTNYVLLDDEFDTLWRAIARYSGLSLEADVATAVESFKSAPERGADTERPSDDTDTD